MSIPNSVGQGSGPMTAIRWRGIENPFGDIGLVLDGILVDMSNHGDSFGRVYVTDDPDKYGELSTSDMELAGYCCK